MTARELYEGVATELNKLSAPEIFLDEFNYYANKGVLQYVEKRYNLYDTNQQTSDDLQALRKPLTITSPNITLAGQTYTAMNGLELTEAIYDVTLPANYLHLTKCAVQFTLQKNYQLSSAGYILRRPAKRLTDDMENSIMENAFQKPSPKRPFFQLMSNPNQVLEDWFINSSYDNAVVLDAINKKAGDEDAHNAFDDADGDGALDSGEVFTGPKMQIQYGRDISTFALTGVDIVYLKTPRYVKLTPEQIDTTEDRSQLLEFPNYVCNEIVKEILALVMYRDGDPRLQAHAAIQSSIPQQPAGAGQR